MRILSIDRAKQKAKGPSHGGSPARGRNRIRAGSSTPDGSRLSPTPSLASGIFGAAYARRDFARLCVRHLPDRLRARFPANPRCCADACARGLCGFRAGCGFACRLSVHRPRRLGRRRPRTRPGRSRNRRFRRRPGRFRRRRHRPGGGRRSGGDHGRQPLRAHVLFPLPGGQQRRGGRRLPGLSLLRRRRARQPGGHRFRRPDGRLRSPRGRTRRRLRRRVVRKPRLPEAFARGP